MSEDHEPAAYSSCESPSPPSEPEDSKGVREAQQSAGSGTPRTKQIRPFRKRSVDWLKSEAKNRGLAGYSKKNKAELVDMLKGSKPATSKAIDSAL